MAEIGEARVGEHAGQQVEPLVARRAEQRDGSACFWTAPTSLISNSSTNMAVGVPWHTTQ